MTGDCLCLNLGIECWCTRPGPGGSGYAPHGTLAAARRHYRADGPGWRCRPCRQAESRRSKDLARLARESRPARLDTAGARQIREMRRRAGMTQAALAAALGVPPQTLSAYETGRYRPAADILDRVAAVTGWQAAA